MTTITPTTPHPTPTTDAAPEPVARLRRAERWLRTVTIVVLVTTLIAIGLGTAANRRAAEVAWTARVDEAATARLQGLADRHEAGRTARANEAATARLQGLADRHEAARTARANEAATARFQALADRHETARTPLGGRD